MTTPSQSTTTSELLTTDEVAELLRTPAATLRYWRHMGTGPASFKIGRRVVYRPDVIAAYLADAEEAGLRRAVARRTSAHPLDRQTPPADRLTLLACAEH